METSTDRAKTVCEQLEEDMAALISSVEKDRQRERHFHQRVRKGMEEVEAHRQFILKKDPRYAFKVKVPVIRKLKQPGQIPYGHFTGLAMKLLREFKQGTYPELKERALAAGLLEEKDVEAVRMAFYQLKRRGAIGFEDGAFTERNNKAAPNGERLHRPEAIVDEGS